MQSLLTLSRHLENLAIRVGKLGAWASVILMMIIVGDVILRRYFVIGSTQLQELEWHLHGILFLLGLGFAYSKGAHVRIELLRDHWSERTKAIVELIGGLIFLVPFAFAIIYFGWDYASLSFQYNESSATSTGLPYRWIIKGVLVIGFIFLLMSVFANMLRCFVWLRTGSKEARNDLNLILTDHSDVETLKKQVEL